MVASVNVLAGFFGRIDRTSSGIRVTSPLMDMLAFDQPAEGGKEVLLLLVWLVVLLEGLFGTQI